MRNKRLVWMGGVLFLFISGWVLSSWYKGSHSGHENMDMSEGKEGEMELWHCPMHPTFTADHKTTCGICGMDLIPVDLDESDEENEVEGQATIKVSKRRQQLIGVKMGQVEVRPFIKVIRTVGRIAYDPELYHVQEEYIGAHNAYEKIKNSAIPESIERAKSLVKSSELRLRLLGLSRQQIKELSRRSGPDTSLLISRATGAVWLYLDVFEYELSSIKVGQSIEATTISYPGEVFRGKVKAIDPIIDPKTRATRVRAEIQNRDGMLKPDMYLNAKIKIDLGERLTVPVSAVMDTGTRRIVFVKDGEGTFEPREVLLGENSEDYYHVKSGLYEWEEVVTSGNFLIDSESKLKASLSALSGGHQHE